jgi:nucleotide-binding universal stress UspA family protein
VPERTLGDRYGRMQEAAAFERAGHVATILDPIQVNPAAFVQRVVEFGQPAEVVRAVATETGATHIVVGSRGQGAVDDVLLASTSGTLARDAPCPVIVVPPRMEDSIVDRDDVVCGVDGSDPSLVAAGHAAQLAGRLAGRLVLAHVSEDGALDGQADAAIAHARAASGVEIELESLRGRPADELLALALRTDAAAIAVGSRGRGPVKAAVLGSVSKELVQKGDRPIMVISKDLPPPTSDPPDAGGQAA